MRIRSAVGFKRAWMCTCFFLVGCAATPYQPLGRSGGYSDHQVGHGLYRIAFQGNSSTSDNQAKDFTLLRCAEITLATGNRYFEIVKAAPNNSAYAEVTIRVLKRPRSVDSSDAVQVERIVRAKYGGKPTESGHTFLTRLFPGTAPRNSE